MVPVSVGVYTLGCKLNQLESEGAARAFGGAGFQVFPYKPCCAPGEKAPDILLINTCTVTSKAEQKARRVIRKALIDYPQALLVVTGCYAQLDPKALSSLSGPESGGKRLFVLAGEKKDALLRLPALIAQSRAPAPSLSRALSQWLEALSEQENQGAGGRFALQPADFSFHARGFLKIQDGCDNRCAYCRVALARGPSASFPAPRALAALRALEARGYAEVVLTGVNICQYRDGSRDLAGLLTYLLDGTSAAALRLSSLEPDGMGPALFEALSHPRIRPHFHLSVQSGSPLILPRMGRRYTPEDLERIAGRLRSAKEDPFLSCDIIAGFPGETDEAFDATFELCRSLDFAGIHCFPYSRRPGTAAWGLGRRGAVPERDARRRVRRLLALGNANKQRYITRWIGKSLEGVVEAPGEPAGPSMLVVSDNYLKLGIALTTGDAPQKGAAVRCRITGLPEQEGAGFDAAGRIIL
ncbi:MAG: tRNA (N(6)-L-threonylcarbamoyladenosine(37)-C(2))-methylthiotransferase MtaB [Spirochaetaceae bacterium]|jgi:threonylcarbamoyladenosine tRNA methylthiotransferase MtaB|nr:tRNA (N(6)-L-threonylcarbamoyladenosine(37)-C(2))-methylthiotransferase MtaB [Spirochaetaceae bacterium]